MNPEHERDSPDHAYIVHNPVSEVMHLDASNQCSDNYGGTTLPVPNTLEKHAALERKIHRAFRERSRRKCHHLGPEKYMF